jgi:hypothetical protein
MGLWENPYFLELSSGIRLPIVDDRRTGPRAWGLGVNGSPALYNTRQISREYQYHRSESRHIRRLLLLPTIGLVFSLRRIFRTKPHNDFFFVEGIKISLNSVWINKPRHLCIKDCMEVLICISLSRDKAHSGWGFSPKEATRAFYLPQHKPWKAGKSQRGSNRNARRGLRPLVLGS